MTKCLYLLLFCSLPMQLLATTFAPISIKNQLKTNSGLVEGQVISMNSELLDGEIVTKVTILPDKWMNLDVDESEVSLYFPGGIMDSRAVKVEGAPTFEIGEKVVVFTNRFKKKNWISNLGLAKFSIKNIGETSVMVNQVFPGHPEVGQMKLNKFHELSKWVKKQDFTYRYKDKYELNYEKQVRLRKKARSRGRSIASIQKDNKETSKNKFPAIWLVLILGSLGVFFGLTKNKS